MGSVPARITAIDPSVLLALDRRFGVHRTGLHQMSFGKAIALLNGFVHVSKSVTIRGRCRCCLTMRNQVRKVIITGFGEMDVTTRGVRTHLGVGTPRPWPDRAIVRTAPALRSSVTMCAQPLVDEPPFLLRQAAWSLPTFSDTLACVRAYRWPSACVCLSTSEHEVVTIPRARCDRLVETLAFAA